MDAEAWAVKAVDDWIAQLTQTKREVAYESSKQYYTNEIEKMNCIRAEIIEKFNIRS